MFQLFRLFISIDIEGILHKMQQYRNQSKCGHPLLIIMRYRSKSRNLKIV